MPIPRFTADALGHQPYIPAHLFGVKLPACASLPSSSQPMVPASAYSDGQESDEDEDGGMHMQHDGGRREKSKAQHAMSPSMSTSDVAERAEEEYLGARYR
jgi:hypothetical protein